MSPNRSSNMSDIEAAKPSFMPLVIECGVAVAVIGGALLGVRQVLIGFVQLLELRLGLLVARMPVGMTLHRRLAEGGLQLSVARRFGNAQGLVEIALGHSSARPSPMHTYDLLFLRRVLSGGAGAILAFAAHDEPGARKASDSAISTSATHPPAIAASPKGEAGRFASGRLHSFMTASSCRRRLRGIPHR